MGLCYLVTQSQVLSVRPLKEEILPVCGSFRDFEAKTCYHREAGSERIFCLKPGLVWTVRVR